MAHPEFQPSEPEDQSSLVNPLTIEDQIDELWNGRGKTAYQQMNLQRPPLHTDNYIVVFDEEEYPRG